MAPVLYVAGRGCELIRRGAQGWQFYAGHKAEQPITYYMRNNVWITTSGNVSPTSLTGAVMALGTDRILFATDYPFDPGPTFLQILESGVLSEADLEKVYRRNALRLFKLGGPAL
jgi:predicted TIM-barrel fold metal-dependent hydrolase